jgi:hypothetical protein
VGILALRELIIVHFSPSFNDLGTVFRVVSSFLLKNVPFRSPKSKGHLNADYQL